MASDIAMHLATGCFSSKTVVMVDSVITQSLFLNTKRCKRPVGMSSVEPLAVNFSLEEEQRERVYNAISKGLKEKKTGMTMTAAYLASANQSAIEIQATDSVLKQLGEEGRSCISWCLASYLMPFNPGSCVTRSSITIGSSRRYGILATRDIKKNDIIYELIGLMPIDNDTPHTRMSEITANPCQNQPIGALRILFGPMRLVNHSCMKSNAAYAAENNTSAFFVYALRDIASGEEVTVDYGQLYSPAGCTCLSCSGPLELQDAAEETEGQRKRRRPDATEEPVEEPAKAQLDHQKMGIDPEEKLEGPGTEVQRTRRNQKKKERKREKRREKAAAEKAALGLGLQSFTFTF